MERSQRCWVPLDDPGRRRTSWTATNRACLRHVGEVTILLRKQRHHEGPKQPPIRGTKLPDARSRQGGDGYRRRWSVERLFTARQSVTGVGHPQVTKDPHRAERSVAMALMADLLRLQFRATDLPAHGPWSAVTLKRHFPWQMAQAQLKRAVEQRLRNALQERQAA